MATLQIELRSPALIPALHTRQSQQQALCPSFSWAGLGGPGRPCSSVTAPTHLLFFMANFVVFLLSLYFFYFLLCLFVIVLHTHLFSCCTLCMMSWLREEPMAEHVAVEFWSGSGRPLKCLWTLPLQFLKSLDG